MPQKHLYCKFGLIGENLDLKQNLDLKINKEGIITDLKFDEINDEIDLNRREENYILIPGMINSHIHIGDSFAKERGHNKGLVEVVSPPYGIKHQLLKETSDSEKVKGIKYAIEEMISNGTTYFMDFRENSVKGIDLLKRALINESIRSMIFGRFNQIDELKEIFTKSDGIGLPSYHNTTYELKSELKKYKSLYNKEIACHVAEVSKNSSLIRQILDDDIVDIIVHGTQLKNHDLQEIKKKKIKMVLCPRSNGYFGLGYPPIRDLMELNIPFSLGTDNVMVNNLDLFEEMRYLYYIAKNQIKIKEFDNLNAKKIFKMVTINAARNFKIQTKVGSISIGKLADLVLIDLNEPNFYFKSMDETGFFSLLLHRTNGRNIKKVYIGGENIYENH